MGDEQIPQKGIDLDIIDLSNLGQSAESPSKKRIQFNPLNYKVFVRSILDLVKGHPSFLNFHIHIKEVNWILRMKYSSANDIATIVSQDAPLTSKLLKLVNNSFYGPFSNKGASNLSEAMIILGTEQIKCAAASLKIYELMRDVAKIKLLRDKTSRGLQRSLIARQIALDLGQKDADAVQLSAMLYDFGEYLVALFALAQYIDIAILMDKKHITLDQASKSILGISYSELGRLVALKLDIPQNIVDTMKPVTNYDIIPESLSDIELQRYVSSFSKTICDINFSYKKAEVSKQLTQVSKQYEQIFDISPERASELLNRSWSKILQHSSLLGITPIVPFR